MRKMPLMWKKILWWKRPFARTNVAALTIPNHPNQELYNTSTGILESEIPDSDDDGNMEENVASILLD